MSSITKQSKVEPTPQEDATESGAMLANNDLSAAAPGPLSTASIARAKQPKASWFPWKKNEVTNRTLWPRFGTLVRWGLAGSLIFFALGQLSDIKTTSAESLPAIRAEISNISEKLEPAEGTNATAGEVGRPLLPHETPITKPLTNRETLAAQLNDIQGLVNTLKSDGNQRLSESMVMQLRRFKKGLLRAQALLPVANTKLEEAPIRLSEKLDESWYGGAISRLNENNFYNKALQQKKRSSNYSAPDWNFSTPVKLAPEELSANPRMKADTVYLASGTVWFLESAKPVSLPSEFDSLVVSPDSIYFSRGDTLSKLDLALGFTDPQWCPGNGPMQIAKSDAALLVRRDKLYRLDNETNSWRVIDAPQLPRTPMVWSTSEDGLVTLGRSDNGHIAYLHIYDESGQLQKTIRLSAPIVIPDKFAWHLLTSGTQLLVIAQSEDLRNRKVYCVEISDGTVGMFQDLSLKRNSKLEKPGAPNPPPHS